MEEDSLVVEKDRRISKERLVHHKQIPSKLKEAEIP